MRPRTGRVTRRPRLVGGSTLLHPSPAALTVVSLSGWTADTSQRLLIDIQVDPAPLTVIPAVVVP